MRIIIGRIKIGWRKRVINIDWTDTVVKLPGEELFADFDSTRSSKWDKDRFIHAWGYEKAKVIIDRLLAVEEWERDEKLRKEADGQPILLMGFFSWKTSDTKRAINNHYSGIPTFTVHMITEDGRHWKETMYDGYGKFGGKDIYELIAEMNGLKSREEGLNLVYETWLVSTDGSRKYRQGMLEGADFFNWAVPLASEGGKTPNELVELNLFKVVYPNGYDDWELAAKNGFKLPKLVEQLPGTQNWKEMWDKLPYPARDPYQGYFYPPEGEEEEED